MALSKEDKSALINLIDVIEKLDDGAKKYSMWTGCTKHSHDSNSNTFSD